MANEDIKLYAKQHKVKLWQVANVLGKSEPTMTRLLRNELSEEAKADFRHIIDELAQQAK